MSQFFYHLNNLTTKKKQVGFEFYCKPMASKRVMSEASAAPLSQKRTVLTQEGIRRLLNCSVELPWAIKAKHLSNFMQKLRNSGYGYKFRKEILLSVLSGYRKIREAAQQGIRPLYRRRGWNKEKRLKKKMQKKKDWLGSYWKSRIFVPYTPGSVLKMKLQKNGGADETRRQGGTPNKNNRDIREHFRDGVETPSQKTNVYSKEMPC